MNPLYEKYALIDAQMKTLTEQKEKVREEILNAMIAAGEDKTETPIGKFSVVKLKKWTYSDKIAEMTDEVKAMKAEEESSGEATFTEEPSLRFVQIKI